MTSTVYLFVFHSKFSNIFESFFFFWSVHEQKSASETDGSFDGLQIKMPMAAQLSFLLAAKFRLSSWPVHVDDV